MLASALSNTSPNVEKEYSQPLTSVASSNIQHHTYEDTQITIYHRTKDDKNEWFAALGKKRLSDFYEHEHQLYAYMETISFQFRLMTAIAEDMTDYKLKQQSADYANFLKQHFDSNLPLDQQIQESDAAYKQLQRNYEKSQENLANFTNHQIESHEAYKEWLKTNGEEQGTVSYNNWLNGIQNQQPPTESK